MNKRGKSWHLIVTALLIVVFSFTALFGVSYTYGDTKNVYIKGAEDIRFGIDIRGGVDVTFMPADGVEATDDQMTAAKTVIEDRLVGLGITDYEDYVDYNKDRIIVRFPWKTGETDFNPQTAIDEIGTTAEMVFRKGSTADGEEILSGDDVTSATAGYNQENGYVVQLQFSADGAKKFAEATTELAAQSNGTISIWLDGENISTATVKTAITDGNAVIEGSFTQDQVTALANQINSGSLPFALSAESFSTISPTLGAKSLDVMVLAGIIAFAFVALLMIVRYRLPGTIAVISLFGQVVATLAFVSGYFTVFNGSTLTLPGIAGIILGIGMGVDANVITAERIKEELGNGKTLDGAIASGFKMGLTPIIDGNVTIVIVASPADGCFWPHRWLLGQSVQPHLLHVWSFHGWQHLLFRLHAAHQCSAQLCLWRVCNPHYDPWCIPLQGVPQPRSVWRFQGWQKDLQVPQHQLCRQPQEVLHLLRRSGCRGAGVQLCLRRYHGYRVQGWRYGYRWLPGRC